MKREVVVKNTHVHFDQMSWPRTGEASGELEWRLRYARQHLTETDLLLAASYIAAYRALLAKTQKDRNSIAKTLIQAERKEQTR